jgi:very-short-patch-repair endonuclease
MYGFLDRATFLDLGLSDATATRRIRDGALERAAAGVYYLDATEPSWEARVFGAILSAGPDAIASHRTAARLWGLDGVISDVIEVTVPYVEGPLPMGFLVHRTRRPLQGVLIDSIPVTSVERTLLDLAGLLPEPVLEKALMSALRRKLTTPDQIAALIVEQGGRGVRGTKKARRVLSRVDDGVPGSPSEVDLRRLIRSAPIPSPECQLQIKLPDGGNAYPDFAWPDRMKIVEIDGLEAHASGDALHNDLIRQNTLMEMGWQVRRFSARAVRREPNEVIAEIVRFINR